MHAFKAERFGDGKWSVCDATGETIHWDEAHVDHVVPLVELAGCWVDERPYLTEEDLATDRPGAVGDSFADDALAVAFRQFHAEAAKLRLVSAKVNLSKGARR